MSKMLGKYVFTETQGWRFRNLVKIQQRRKNRRAERRAWKREE